MTKAGIDALGRATLAHSYISLRLEHELRGGRCRGRAGLKVQFDKNWAFRVEWQKRARIHRVQKEAAEVSLPDVRSKTEVAS
jgi:hypothetical protein